MNKFLTSIVTVLLFFITFSLGAQLRFYRQLPSSEIPLSPHYKVEIKQGNNDFQEIYTYQIIPNDNSHVTKNDQFANFGYNPEGGPVQIRVTRKDNVALTSTNSRLMNKTLTDVSQTHSGGAIVITCSSVKRHLYVSVDGKKEYPLMIFVDPFADTAYPSTANVVTFPARSTPYVQTAQYDRYTVPNNVDVVVIEDGAILKGTLHVENSRTKPLLVTGRGVILGNGAVLHGSANIPYNAVVLKKGNGHIMENVMVVNSRHFTTDIGPQGLVDNIKMYGYDTNNDGIVGFDNSKITNVFSKVNDDHIKLYFEKMQVSNCTFWVQQNGALFQLAWNSIVPGSNCLVENCEVLAWEAGCGDPRLGQGGVARTFINLREYEGTNAPISKNNTFRNIYVQGQIDRFIGINGKYGDSKPISLENYVLENITIEKKPSRYAWMYTGGTSKLNFTFKNVTIAGECLTASNYQFITEGDVTLNYSGCGSSTDILAPSIPTNLQVSNITQNGASFTWLPSTDNVGVTGYEVFVNNTLLETTATNTLTINTLECASTYEVKVRAKDAVGNVSSFSTVTTFTTLNCNPTINDITQLSATNINCSTIKLNWNDVLGETAYRIRRKLENEAVFTTLGDVLTNVVEFTDTDVSENNTYIYQVRPLLNGVAVANSNLSTITSESCAPPLPDDIGDLSSINPLCTSIDLTWSDISNEDGYRILRKTQGLDYSIVTDIAANETSYKDETVIPNTTYQYMVRPLKDGVAVAISNEVEVTTPECPPVDITDLIATSTSCTQVNLTWGDVSGEEGYRIRRRLTTETVFTNLGDVVSGVTSYEDATVVFGKEYVYMVRPLVGGVAVKISNLATANVPTCISCSETSPLETRIGMHVGDLSYTGTDGYTYYCNASGNLLLGLSLAQGLSTNPSVVKLHISDPEYVYTAGNTGFVSNPSGGVEINRRWDVLTTGTSSGTSGVKYFLEPEDLSAVQEKFNENQEPGINSLEEMTFYKVLSSGDNTLTSFGEFTRDKVALINNGELAGTNSYVIGELGDKTYVEYRVSSFSTGGAFVGSSGVTPITEEERAEIARKQGRVWPTVTDSELNIKLLPTEKGLPIIIYNAQGSVLRQYISSELNEVLDVSSLASGMYFLSINGETHKFLKF